jgi:mRNA-degrading endonuclease RelE of RelBE toxin-antitoxin system
MTGQEVDGLPTWSKRAQRDLDALPPAMQDRARLLADRLDTEHGLGKKLLGPLKGIRSARLGRSHRVLYEIESDGRAHILTVAQRRDVYR